METFLLRSHSLARIAQHAASQWDQHELGKMDRAGRAFRVLIGIHRRMAILPENHREAFLELWDLFGTEQLSNAHLRQRDVAPENSHMNALSEDQIDQCELLTRSFAITVRSS